jgi:CrcB protein
MTTWIAVALAGGFGAVARFLVDTALSARTRRALPFGTLAVNLSGALILGALAGATVDGDAYLVAGTGLIGAYTTFSTWMLETHRLAENGRAAAALANIVGSLALGLGAVALGHTIGAAL